MTLVSNLIARNLPSVKRRYKMHFRRLGHALCGRPRIRRLTSIPEIVTCGECQRELLADATKDHGAMCPCALCEKLRAL